MSSFYAKDFLVALKCYLGIEQISSNYSHNTLAFSLTTTVSHELLKCFHLEGLLVLVKYTPHMSLPSKVARLKRGNFHSQPPPQIKDLQIKNEGFANEKY